MVRLNPRFLCAISLILGMNLALQVAPAQAERGYHVYRHLQVQSKLYKQLGRTSRAAEALIEAYEHYPDEQTLLDAVELLAEATEDERALRLVERYLTITRSPLGHLQGRKLLV
ncbi:MAG TPA: hypothetical protein EYN06_01550, partial [Myxococcales bacterium]|nr:hypothetical protein [Myxococcales bacterium]